MKLTITKQFQDFISSLGLSLELLLQEAHIPNLLWKEELVVNEEQYYSLLQVFDDHISDQQILDFSMVENISMFLPPIYVALAAKNGLEGIERFIKFKKFVGPIDIKMKVLEKTVEIRFSFVFPHQKLPRFALLNEQLLLLSLLRKGSEKEIIPRFVKGPYSYSKTITTYLKCLPKKSEDNLLIFNLEDLNYSFSTQNNIMWEFIKPELEKRLSVVLEENSVIKTIQNELIQAISRGQFSLQEVSKALGVSARTLQRTLQAEGTTFNEQLQNAQKSLSLYYLENGTISTAEIAYLVGYSDTSSFSRAFKSWTKKNISQYKKEIKQVSSV